MNEQAKDPRDQLEELVEAVGPNLLIGALKGGAFLEVEEIPAQDGFGRRWRIRLLVE